MKGYYKQPRDEEAVTQKMIAYEVSVMGIQERCCSSSLERPRLGEYVSGWHRGISDAEGFTVAQAAPAITTDRILIFHDQILMLWLYLRMKSRTAQENYTPPPMAEGPFCPLFLSNF